MNIDSISDLSRAQIEAAARKRQQALDLKAEQAAGGQIVSVLAYRSDYVAVNEEVQVIDSTLRDKNCPPVPPPSKSAPKPASPR